MRRTVTALLASISLCAVSGCQKQVPPATAQKPTAGAVAFRAEHGHLRSSDTRGADAASGVGVGGQLELQVFCDWLEAGASKEIMRSRRRSVILVEYRLESPTPLLFAGQLPVTGGLSKQFWPMPVDERE